MQLIDPGRRKRVKDITPKAGCDEVSVAAQGDGNRNLEKINSAMNLGTASERLRTSV
jgi:hypothetical protein